MASRDVSINLVAKDGSTQTFRNVGRAAETMGRDIEQAGKQGARSLKEIEAASKRAEEAGRNLGQGAALLGAAFVVSAQSATTQRREIESLERAFGDNADAILDWTQAIEDSSNISDEAARKAALFASTLSQEYGLSLEQVQTLLQRMADVAEDRGFAFEDASQRIVAAIRGEAESAEVLGIVANDASLGIDKMSTSTTNAERAQIRFDAIMDQTAESAGVAAEAADSTRGRVIDLANAATDASQAFADWTGPIGEAAGELGSFGLEAGLAAGGLVKLGQGVRGLSGAAGIGGLVASMGPLGLVAAAGVAGVAIAELTGVIDLFGDEEVAVVGETDSLTEALDRLAASGFNTTKLDAYRSMLDDIQQSETSLQAQLEKDRAFLDMMADLPGPAFERFGGEGAIAAVEREIALIEAQIGKHDELQTELNETDAAFATLAESINEPGYDKAVANIDLLIKAYNDQTIAQKETEFTREELLQGIQDTVATLPEYNRQANAATDSTVELARAQIEASHAGETWIENLLDQITTLDQAALGGNEAARAMGDQSAALAEYANQSAQARTPTEALNTEVERSAVASGEAARSFEDVAAKSDLVVVAASAQEMAYRNLTSGVLTANEAQAVFKITQDGLIESQGVYSHQQSEYEAQLGSLQEAEDILNQRRAEGIALTADQEDFLNRVDAAQERMTGGAEDAAIAEGMLALQYAENVRIGDQLNDTMEGQQAITGALIDLVFDLIGALDGIPEDVRTEIELAGADHAINQAASLAATLASIPASVRTEVVTAFIQTGDPNARNVTPGGAFGTGGTVRHMATGGTALAAANGIVVGEVGPELILNPPHGMQVMPYGASMSRLELERLNGAGGGDSTINLNVKATVDLRAPRMGGNQRMRQMLDADVAAAQAAEQIEKQIAAALRAHNYASSRS